MSYTRANPVRPTRTTGRPPVGSQSNAFGASAGPTNPTSQTPSATDSQERVLEYRGAYSVKAPDPAKRDEIQKVAEAETRSYERHKQTRKQVQYSTTAAAVGSTQRREVNSYDSVGRLSSVPSSSTAAAARRNVAAAPKLKPPSLRSQSLRMEDPEIQRRKAVQRQKAESLNAKQNLRQGNLDEERRRKNNQFLDRLEGKR